MRRGRAAPALAVGTNGAEGGYGEAHMAEADARRRLATRAKVVMEGGVGNGGVGGEASGGRAASGNGGGAGDVKSLDVDDGIREASIQVSKNNVGLLGEDGTVALHPGAHSGVPTRTTRLGDDAATAEGGGEAVGKGIAGGIVDGGVEAHAITV